MEGPATVGSSAAGEFRTWAGPPGAPRKRVNWATLTQLDAGKALNMGTTGAFAPLGRLERA
jgi:hypothetical protein